MPLNIRRNVSLLPLTTLRTGGTANYYTVISSESQLEEACNWAKNHSLNIFVLGGGSNVLISDRGFDGLVIKMNIKGINIDDVAEVKAGENWDDFVKRSVKASYCGLECLSGIPGQVGSAAVQNIGAYGQEISQTLLYVRFLDLTDLKFKEFSNKNCCFEYRNSIFKGDKDKVVVSVKLKLSKDLDLRLLHKELREKFCNHTPNVLEIRKAVLALRKSKSMLLDKRDPNTVSAGCFFKNPVVKKALFEKLNKQFENVPNWPEKNGLVKLSAGWLVEKSGFEKGYVFKNGKVGLSEKHALVIVNKGNANSADILELSQLVQEKVQLKFGVQLISEVVLIGF